MKTETNRSTGLREEIEALRHMTVGQLKDKYRDVFSESSRSNHKQFLFRRIAWRMQANTYGGPAQWNYTKHEGQLVGAPTASAKIFPPPAKGK